MDTVSNSRPTRIAVFFDGHFFLQASSFFQFEHQRKARLDFRGIGEFIRQQIAGLEGVPLPLCQIVSKQYFRGRLPAREAEARGVLLKERVFEDILLREQILTRFLPSRNRDDGDAEEKGVDVALALEAYELAVSRHIDVIVLISGDGDFVPLLQKIALIGPRTMVLGGNFDQVSSSGSIIQTRTSSALLEAATYPILLNDLADDPARANDPFVTGLFLGGKDEPASPEPAVQESAMPEPDPVCTGVVLSIKEGYGFIAPSDPTHKGNLFFHHSQIENTEFGRLTPGDRVTFVIDNSNIKGPSAIRVHLVETAKEEPR